MLVLKGNVYKFEDTTIQITKIVENGVMQSEVFYDRDEVELFFIILRHKTIFPT